MKLNTVGVKCLISWLKHHCYHILEFVRKCGIIIQSVSGFHTPSGAYSRAFLFLLNTIYLPIYSQMSTTYALLKAKVRGPGPRYINTEALHLYSSVNSELCFTLVLEAFKAANKSRPP